jgi:hypothetical protein
MFMRKLSCVLMACVSLLTTSVASAAPLYDFTARVLNISVPQLQPQRLVSVFAQDAADLSGRGSITVYFVVHRLGSGNAPVGDPLFEGEATINNGQTSVVTGSPNAGRITLTYDPTLDRLEAQFVMRMANAQVGAAYEIRATDYQHNLKALILTALG